MSEQEESSMYIITRTDRPHYHTSPALHALQTIIQGTGPTPHIQQLVTAQGTHQQTEIQNIKDNFKQDCLGRVADFNEIKEVNGVLKYQLFSLGAELSTKYRQAKLQIMALQNLQLENTLKWVLDAWRQESKKVTQSQFWFMRVHLSELQKQYQLAMRTADGLRKENSTLAEDLSQSEKEKVDQIKGLTVLKEKWEQSMKMSRVNDPMRHDKMLDELVTVKSYSSEQAALIIELTRQLSKQKAFYEGEINKMRLSKSNAALSQFQQLYREEKEKIFDKLHQEIKNLQMKKESLEAAAIKLERKLKVKKVKIDQLRTKIDALEEENLIMSWRLSPDSNINSIPNPSLILDCDYLQPSDHDSQQDHN